MPTDSIKLLPKISSEIFCRKFHIDLPKFSEQISQNFRFISAEILSSITFDFLKTDLRFEF